MTNTPFAQQRTPVIENSDHRFAGILQQVLYHTFRLAQYLPDFGYRKIVHIF